jgi:membrane protease YdiL (CAAX protease family)
MIEIAHSTLAPDTDPPKGLVPFLVAVFGLTWLLLLPAGLAQRGLIAGPVERFIPIVIIGFWSPTLAALLVARITPGAGGLSGLLRPLGKWRVKLRWYLLALGLPAAIYASGIGAGRLLTGSAAGPWISLPHDGQRMAAMLMLPLVDQIGWRGFAYPRLARRNGSLVASLILGVLWGVWHTAKQLLFNEGVESVPPPFMMLYFVAGTIVFTWIYIHTGGSLLLVVLAQMGAYLTNPSPSALRGQTSPLAINTVAYVVVAVALVALDRKAWRSPPTPAYRADGARSPGLRC